MTCFPLFLAKISTQSRWGLSTSKYLFPRGSCEAQQPRAKLHNRFAVFPTYNGQGNSIGTLTSCSTRDVEIKFNNSEAISRWPM
jgi:hypothetical protein